MASPDSQTSAKVDRIVPIVGMNNEGDQRAQISHPTPKATMSQLDMMSRYPSPAARHFQGVAVGAVGVTATSAFPGVLIPRPGSCRPTGTAGSRWL